MEDFLAFAEELAEGLPDRPGPIFPDLPDLVPRSQELGPEFDRMLKRPSNNPRGGFRKRARGSKAAATAAVTKIAKQVAIKQHELKTVNQAYIASGIVNTGGLYLLNGIAQGVGGGQRIGRDVRIEFIDFHYQLATSANVADTIRLVIFKDKECRGAAPTAADLWTNQTPGVMQLSTWNQDNIGVRFKVLHDQIFNVVPRASIPLNAFQKKILVRSNTHYYDVATAGIAGIDSGSIYLWLCSTTAASTNAGLDINVYYRDS